MNDRLSVLMEEYKQMRNEIRTSYSLYFSVLFGVIFTGIIAAFLKAPTNQWLYIVIPFLMNSWIGVVTFIRCNIQHISRYIIEIEKEINRLVKMNGLLYETEHAPSLWFSKLFVALGAITAIPFIICYIYCLYKGYNWLSSAANDYFINDEYLFLLISVMFGLIIVYLFVEIPKKTRFKESSRLHWITEKNHVNQQVNN